MIPALKIMISYSTLLRNIVDQNDYNTVMIMQHYSKFINLLSIIKKLCQRSINVLYEERAKNEDSILTYLSRDNKKDEFHSWPWTVILSKRDICTRQDIEDHLMYLNEILLDHNLFLIENMTHLDKSNDKRSFKDMTKHRSHDIHTGHPHQDTHDHRVILRRQKVFKIFIFDCISKTLQFLDATDLEISQIDVSHLPSIKLYFIY